MTITQILQPNCIKIPVQNKGKEAAITELIDLLNTNGLILDRDIALEAVLTRKRTCSAGIGAEIDVYNLLSEIEGP
ncbi:MAG: PTS sugar transporter subunit IIA [Sedimentisphaerales bacterium]|nr:PTS sugar transporter subunit IIA [Sedimentisphaerales bacterium]